MVSTLFFNIYWRTYKQILTFWLYSKEFIKTCFGCFMSKGLFWCVLKDIFYKRSPESVKYCMVKESLPIKNFRAKFCIWWQKQKQNMIGHGPWYILNILSLCFLLLLFGFCENYVCLQNSKVSAIGTSLHSLRPLECREIVGTCKWTFQMCHRVHTFAKRFLKAILW